MAIPHTRSHALIEQDRASIWHPFTQMHTARTPIPIARAEGVYLFTEEGSRYVDAISSWWVNLHGHAHPYIVEKIHAQAAVLEHVIFADFTHRPAIELASRLLALLPGRFSKIFYSDNGSTSVEVALKMALQYWHNQNTPKNQIVCFKNSYHGDTFGAMSAAGKNAFNKPFWNHLFNVTCIDPPLPGHEKQTLSQLQSLLNEEDVACFLFEPLILGVGGMIIYPAEGLNPLIRLCKARGVLTIADEVMTGFGRTGTLFACEQLKEECDLICLSKGLTGGFLPLGVTACSQKIFNAFLSDHMQSAFLHGHSYTANPLACASALASLDLLLKNECYRQRKEIEASHRAFCQKWHSHPKLKRCENLGVILVLEYRVDTPSYFHSIRERLYSFFLSKGILLRPFGNVLHVLPPYCISKEEVQAIYDHIIFTLEEDI
ncbi:MAG TPA: adenosylmethionine--8-amino-7-oxononanoate transaminase [Rhabdochlamydiaceae bacterium]|jgi:adenosylmethionine-8-amino-7-oxononanoate aminotransferase